MTIPSSGTFTSTDIKNEWGFGLPFTSAQVASAAGLSSSWSSADLRGKSARTIQLIITSFEQVQMGFGDWNRQQYDKITFGISVSPYLAPTSYSWGNDVYGTGASAVFMGPTYQPMGFTYQSFGNAYCSVVVGGRTYELSLDFQYTAGDAL